MTGPPTDGRASRPLAVAEAAKTPTEAEKWKKADTPESGTRTCRMKQQALPDKKTNIVCFYPFFINNIL